MIWIILLVHVAIAYGFYRWLRNGQYACVFSPLGLFCQCLLWPIGLILWYGMDWYIHLRYSGDDPKSFLEDWELKKADCKKEQK